MINKGRKLIALLLMVALVVTYTFGANLSVFAEEPQGDANAKTSASESADPAPATEDTAKEEPAPAPAPEVSESEASDESDVKVEEGSEGTIEVEETAPVKATPPIQHGTVRLDYGVSYSSFTPDSTMHPHQGEVEHWEVSSESSATDCYTWNANAHRVKNTNTTESAQTIQVIHMINKVGNQGSSRSEIWNVVLAPAPKVTVYYHKNDGQGYGTTVHTETVVWDTESSMWGIPSREGWTFTYWTIGHGGPHYHPGDTFTPSDFADHHGEVHILAHWEHMSLGPVHGKSDTVDYTGEEQFLYGITEDSEVTEGYAEFYRHSSGGIRPITTFYYVKATDVFAKGTEPGEYNTEAGYALVYSWTSSQHGGTPSSTGMYVEVVPGTLTIEEPMYDGEVHAKSDTVPYTGEEQAVYGITENSEVTEGYAQFDAAAGSFYAVKAEDIYAKGTEVGEYTTTVEKALVYTRANLPGSSWHSTGKYVKVVPGTLEILGIFDGEVHGKSDAVPYTGEEQVLYGITENPDITEGYVPFKTVTFGHITTQYFVKAEDIFAKGTEVGEYTTTAEYARVYSRPVMAGSQIHETKFFVKVVPGTLEILGIFDGEVHGKSDSVVFDGEEHVLYGITENPDITEGYVPFKTVSYGHISTQYFVKAEDIFAKGTAIGEYTTTAEYARVYSRAVMPGAPYNETKFFVKVVPGTLEILGTMKFAVEPYEDIYDGQPHTVTVDTSNLPEGYTLEYSISGPEDTNKWTTDAPTWTDVELDDSVKPTKIATHKVWVKATCKGYAPEVVESYVKILPRPVEIAVELSNDSRPYNGELQTFIAEFTFSTKDEVLNSAPGYDPAYIGNKHDYWAKGTEVGKYYTEVEDAPEFYSLGFTPGDVMNNNFDPSFSVTQGCLEIYSEPATLTFKLNGGNVGGDTSDIIVEANTGDTVTIINAPTRKGYEFQYWEGSKYYPGDEYKVMGDHTFTAVWAKTSPSGGDDSDKDKKGKDGNGSSTGDEAGLIGIMALMAAALLGLTALTALRRREE